MAKQPNFTGYSHEQMKALLKAGRETEDAKTAFTLLFQLTLGLAGTVLIVFGVVALFVR